MPSLNQPLHMSDRDPQLDLTRSDEGHLTALCLLFVPRCIFEKEISLYCDIYRFKKKCFCLVIEDINKLSQ